MGFVDEKIAAYAEATRDVVRVQRDGLMRRADVIAMLLAVGLAEDAVGDVLAHALEREMLSEDGEVLRSR